jgi:hypothetical protein
MGACLSKLPEPWRRPKGGPRGAATELQRSCIQAYHEFAHRIRWEAARRSNARLHLRPPQGALL